MSLEHLIIAFPVTVLVSVTAYLFGWSAGHKAGYELGNDLKPLSEKLCQRLRQATDEAESLSNEARRILKTIHPDEWDV